MAHDLIPILSRSTDTALDTISMPPPETVLIVDDYPDSLDVWSVYLRAAGYRVLTAGDGREALESATRHLPDLAVLDLELPTMDGWAVAQALRANPSTREIPLIAATGCSNARLVEHAWQVGFDNVLVKPCDPDRLVAEIRRLLATRRQQPSDVPGPPRGRRRTL
jgi:CheY-like chemotaxis protein